MLKLGAELSLGLIIVFLLFISRRFDWRENIVLFILALGLLPGARRLKQAGPIEFNPFLFIILFFVTSKLTLAFQARGLAFLTLFLFATAVFCFRWRAGRIGNRIYRDQQFSQKLAAAGVVLMTAAIFLILKILNGGREETPVSLLTLLTILFLFTGSYLLSALPGKQSPFSRPIKTLWVTMPLIIVIINTARGWNVWEITREARRLERAGDHEKALAAYRHAGRINKSLDIRPIRIERLIAEAREAGKQGDVEAAISFYQKAADDGLADPELLLHAGDLYLERNLHRRAYRMYASAAKQARKKSEIRKSLANRFIELGRFSEAADQLDRISPAEVSPSAGAEQNLALARVYESRGELENAAAYLKEALRHNQSDRENLRNLLTAEEASRNELHPDRSREEISRATGEINYALGIIHKRLNNQGKAEAYLRQALDGEAPVLSAHYILGQIYEESDPRSAIGEYLELVRRLPDHIDGLKRLRALLKRGKYPPQEEMSLKTLDSRIASLTPSIPVGANLENEVIFLGYDLHPRILTRGRSFTIAYYWKGLKKMSRNWRVYVHFDDSIHNRVRFQFDHEPLGGDRPTSTWEPGCVVKEEYTLMVPDDIIPGNYLLRVGMFDSRGDKHNLKPLDSEGEIDWRLISQDNTNRLNAGSVIIQ